MIFKICGLKNKETLFCCEENKVDFFGMIFYEKSPRFIDFDSAISLIDYAKDKPIIVLNNNGERLGVIGQSDLLKAVVEGNDNE